MALFLSLCCSSITSPYQPISILIMLFMIAKSTQIDLLERSREPAVMWIIRLVLSWRVLQSLSRMLSSRVSFINVGAMEQTLKLTWRRTTVRRDRFTASWRQLESAECPPTPATVTLQNLLRSVPPPLRLLKKNICFWSPSSPSNSALEYASLKVYVFGFYQCFSTMNYARLGSPRGLADVMLSGVIKIFRCIPWGGWGGMSVAQGLKDLCPLRLSVSHCTLSLSSSVRLSFAYML